MKALYTIIQCCQAYPTASFALTTGMKRHTSAASLLMGLNKANIAQSLRRLSMVPKKPLTE